MISHAAAEGKELIWLFTLLSPLISPSRAVAASIKNRLDKKNCSKSLSDRAFSQAFAYQTEPSNIFVPSHSVQVRRGRTR